MEKIHICSLRTLLLPQPPHFLTTTRHNGRSSNSEQPENVVSHHHPFLPSPRPPPQYQHRLIPGFGPYPRPSATSSSIYPPTPRQRPTTESAGRRRKTAQGRGAGSERGARGGWGCLDRAWAGGAGGGRKGPTPAQNLWGTTKKIFGNFREMCRDGLPSRRNSQFMHILQQFLSIFFYAFYVQQFKYACLCLYSLIHIHFSIFLTWKICTQN